MTALLIRVLAPTPPNLVVSWPDAEKLGRATLQNGATVAIRSGEPFVVMLSDTSAVEPDEASAVAPVNAQKWDVSWSYVGARGTGWPVVWPPSGSLDKLEMSCRARAVGWQKAVSWLWPTRELWLWATAPVALGERRFVVVPMAGEPVRVSSRVVASREARWDERALPLLEFAVRHAKALQPSATWTIVNAPTASEPNASAPTASAPNRQPIATTSTRNSASADKTSADKTNSDDSAFPPSRDTATYVVLSPGSFGNSIEALTQCAQIIAARAPQIGIKWIAREKPVAGQPGALLWLDFAAAKKTVPKRRRKSAAPAKKIGARGGWFVRAGTNQSVPVDWWSEAKKPPGN